jgi:hypothetical protein
MVATGRLQNDAFELTLYTAKHQFRSANGVLAADRIVLPNHEHDMLCVPQPAIHMSGDTAVVQFGCNSMGRKASILQPSDFR